MWNKLTEDLRSVTSLKEFRYAKFLSNINAIVTYVNSSLMYRIYDFICFIYLFFFLGEISYTATLVNPRWNKGDVCMVPRLTGFHWKAMFLVTSPFVINVPPRGLLAVETVHAIVHWLANLNIKRNMTSMFVNKKHRYMRKRWIWPPWAQSITFIKIYTNVVKVQTIWDLMTMYLAHEVLQASLDSISLSVTQLFLYNFKYII